MPDFGLLLSFLLVLGIGFALGRRESKLESLLLPEDAKLKEAEATIQKLLEVTTKREWKPPEVKDPELVQKRKTYSGAGQIGYLRGRLSAAQEHMKKLQENSPKPVRFNICVYWYDGYRWVVQDKDTRLPSPFNGAGPGQIESMVAILQHAKGKDFLDVPESQWRFDIDITWWERPEVPPVPEVKFIEIPVAIPYWVKPPESLTIQEQEARQIAEEAAQIAAKLEVDSELNQAVKRRLKENA